MRGDGRLLTSHPPWRALNEMRDEFVEMQGRIGELGREMAKVCDLTRYAIHHSTTCSNHFVLHDPCTDELLSNHPPILPFSPTKYTTGLSYYGDLHRRNSVSPPFISPLHDPRPTTVITSAIPNLRSSQPRRGFTTSVTFNEQRWICVACRRWRRAMLQFDPTVPECCSVESVVAKGSCMNLRVPCSTPNQHHVHPLLVCAVVSCFQDHSPMFFNFCLLQIVSVRY
jgi:hypothetical protein